MKLFLQTKKIVLSINIIRQAIQLLVLSALTSISFPAFSRSQRSLFDGLAQITYPDRQVIDNIFYLWGIAFALGLIGLFFFFAKKGFHTEMGYIHYKNFWWASAITLSIINTIQWQYHKPITIDLPAHSYVFLAFVCPLILLFITLAPAEIYRFIHRKK